MTIKRSIEIKMVRETKEHLNRGGKRVAAVEEEQYTESDVARSH